VTNNGRVTKAMQLDDQAVKLHRHRSRACHCLYSPKAANHHLNPWFAGRFLLGHGQLAPEHTTDGRTWTCRNSCCNCSPPRHPLPPHHTHGLTLTPGLLVVAP
jgi:hypothetical protein